MYDYCTNCEHYEICKVYGGTCSTLRRRIFFDNMKNRIEKWCKNDRSR